VIDLFWPGLAVTGPLVSAAATRALQQRSQRRPIAELAESRARHAELLIEGLSNKLSARRLALSPRTVETHRANILRKMEVESVTALARGMASLSS
jgi:two-component system, LuxR family, response regulator FixJ